MKEIILDAWSIFTKNLYHLFAIVIPYAVIMSLVDLVLVKHVTEYGLSVYLLYVFKLIILSIYTPILVLFLSQAIYNKIRPIKEIVLLGMTHFPYMLISYLIVLFPFALLTYFRNLIGLNSFIYLSLNIVLICVVLKAVFSSYLIVLEENKPVESLVNSFRYTRGYVLTILSVGLIFALPISLAGGIAKMIFSALALNSDVIMFSSGTISGFLMVLIQIVFFKIYCLNYIERKKSSN